MIQNANGEMRTGNAGKCYRLLVTELEFYQETDDFKSDYIHIL
jgi:hypothetical protein